jgi:hypothetical protein
VIWIDFIDNKWDGKDCASLCRRKSISSALIAEKTSAQFNFEPFSFSSSGKQSNVERPLLLSCQRETLTQSNSVETSRTVSIGNGKQSIIESVLSI